MKDLFEHQEELPSEIREIINQMDDDYINDILDYNDLSKYLKEMEALGYTFDYYLDGVPYNLRKM